MSRIHEAMQRAAGQADAHTQDGGAHRRVPDVAIEELAREAFPIEMSEHRRTKAAPPASPPAAPASPAASTAAPAHPGPAPATATILPAEPGRRLALETVDRRYQGKTVLDGEVAPASREQYRRLAATLHHAQEARGTKVVMVTSAVVSEGKTLTSANLAVTLSESYKKRVLLVDADLRRPAIHTLFGIPPGSGLSDGLMSGDGHPVAVRQVSPRLAVLSAGRPTSDPMAGLISERMRRLLDEARESFDWVIVDTPPVTLLPDANLLAAMVDGTILVVKAGHTSWELVQRAVDAVGRDRILGIVLNQASTSPHGYGYADYYYHYYSRPAEAQPTSP